MTKRITLAVNIGLIVPSVWVVNPILPTEMIIWSRSLNNE